MAEIFKIDKTEIKDVDQNSTDKMLDYVVQRIETETKLTELHKNISDSFDDQNKTEIEVDMDKIKDYLTSIKDLSRNEIASKGGAWVISIQIALKKIGYDVGKIDGHYGGANSKTYNAVLKFQKDVNAKGGDKVKEDGRAGSETINKILENREGIQVLPTKLDKATIEKDPAKYHLVGPDTNGKYEPADGYERVDNNDPDNYAVKKKAPETLPTKLDKATIEKDPAKYHLVGPDTNGKYEPADGYERVDNNDPDNYAVKKEVQQGLKELTEQEAKTFTGKGKYTFKSGDIYEGDWKNGKSEGVGKYIFKNGDIYEGDFKGGNFEGKGKLVKKDGSYFEGEFKNNGYYNGTKYDKNKNIIVVYKNGQEDPNRKINQIKAKFPNPAKDLISSNINNDPSKQFKLKGIDGVYFEKKLQANNFILGLNAVVDQFAYKGNKNKAPFAVSDGGFWSKGGNIYYLDNNGEEKFLEDGVKNRSNANLKWVEDYKGDSRTYKDEVEAVVKYLNGLKCR